MSRVSTVKPHLTVDGVKDKIARAPTARCQQKWMIIYNALVDPRPAIEIAKHTATSLRTVHQVIGAIVWEQQQLLLGLNGRKIPVLI